MTHFLVENKAFHKLGIVNCTAEFLHDLDISEIDDIRFRGIDNREDGINSERSEETGVLTNDLAVKRSGSGLDERLAIGKLDRYSHGGEDIHGFESGLMERIGDNRRVNTMGEQREALTEKSAGDDDDGGGAVTGGGVLGLGELDEHLSGGLEDLHLVEDGGAVVGYDDVAGGGGDHLVHATWTETGADGVGDGAGGEDVGLPDVFFALVVHVGLRLGAGSWESDCCW